MFIEISLQRYKNSGINERKKRFFFISIKQITENNRVFCTVEKQTHTTAKFGALQILKSQRQILKSQRQILASHAPMPIYRCGMGK